MHAISTIELSNSQSSSYIRREAELNLKIQVNHASYACGMSIATKHFQMGLGLFGNKWFIVDPSKNEV